MKHCIIDGILYVNGQSTNLACSEAEKEFWMRIQELETVLMEISSRTRRPSKRGGAAQIVLSAEQMAEIAEKALITA